MAEWGAKHNQDHAPVHTFPSLAIIWPHLFGSRVSCADLLHLHSSLVVNFIAHRLGSPPLLNGGILLLSKFLLQTRLELAGSHNIGGTWGRQGILATCFCYVWSLGCNQQACTLCLLCPSKSLRQILLFKCYAPLACPHLDLARFEILFSPPKSCR